MGLSIYPSALSLFTSHILRYDMFGIVMTLGAMILYHYTIALIPYDFLVLSSFVLTDNIVTIFCRGSLVLKYFFLALNHCQDDRSLKCLSYYDYQCKLKVASKYKNAFATSMLLSIETPEHTFWSMDCL